MPRTVPLLDRFVVGAASLDDVRDWVYADDRRAVLGDDVAGELLNLDYARANAAVFARRVLEVFHGEMWPGRLARLRARPLLAGLVDGSGALEESARALDALGHAVDWVPAHGAVSRDVEAHRAAIVANARAKLADFDALDAADER